MRQSDLIKRNTIFAFTSQALRLLTSAIAFVMIARLYGPVEFGQFTAAHTVSAIFVLFADFGFDMLVSSEVARQRDMAQQLVHAYLPAKICFAGLSTVAMFVFGFVAGVSASTRDLIFIFSLYVLVTSLTSFFFALFKSYEELHHETKISTLINLALLAALGTTYFIPLSIFVVAAMFVGSRVVGLVLSLRVAGKTISLRGFRFTLPAKDVAKKIGVFGLYTIFTNLYFVQDTVLLSIWRGDYDAGVYQAVMKVAGLALILVDIAALTLLPVFSRLHQEDYDRWFEFGKLLNKSLVFLGLPLSLGLIFFARPIIDILYGLQSFHDAVPILQLFGGILFVRYLAETSAIMLTTSMRQIHRLVIVLAATVLNFTLNAVLIPTHGPLGAGVVSLFTSICVALGVTIVARRQTRKWILQFRSFVPVLISIVLAIAAAGWDGLNSPYAGVLAVIGIVVFSYFFVYTKEERKFIFSFDTRTLIVGSSLGTRVD